jgi:hypothetical protein
VAFTLGLTPRPSFSVSTTVGYSRDDFDSDVKPVQPLPETSLADREAVTPGDQLGLLRNERRQLSLDLFYGPSENIILNASIGWDQGDPG